MNQVWMTELYRLKYINKYLKTYPAECTDYLFINKNGDELTRSGVVYEHALINLYLKQQLRFQAYVRKQLHYIHSDILLQ